jgi:hypothetical protein
VKRPPGGHTPGMAIKDIIGSLLGRRQPSAEPADKPDSPSGSPHTVGAPKAGEAGAPRSATSSAPEKTSDTGTTGS